VDSGKVVLWELRVARRLLSEMVRLLVGKPLLRGGACCLRLLRA
jgi:hypothetical protein